jgi:putative sigma-54 modulation protein
MKIQIRAQDIKVTKALKAHVELRLGFALSRFGEKIGHVAVELSTSDERSDRTEKRCRIAVSLPRCVKVQETDADVFAAVDRAAVRAARSVAHAIDQDRTSTLSPVQLWKNKKPRSPAALLRVTKRRTGTT